MMHGNPDEALLPRGGEGVYNSLQRALCLDAALLQYLLYDFSSRRDGVVFCHPLENPSSRVAATALLQ